MATMAYEAESEFCMAALNLLREKYQGQIETKFLASNQYMRIAVRSNEQFRTEDIENIVECLNDEFEIYAMSRLKWSSKPKIESGHITLNFPFSVAFVYSKNNNESRYCWQTLS